MTIAAQKASLRRSMSAHRATLDPAVGAALATHVLNAGIIPQHSIVAGYWPLPHEIDILFLLRALHSRGQSLCLPETTSPGQPLIFRAWTPQAQMMRGRYNTLHPHGPRSEPDYFLVPLLAFDRAGHRLGHGGGYYDRTLALLPAAFRLGCAFAAQEVPDLPVETNDLPLHAIATETGIFRIAEG